MPLVVLLGNQDAVRYSCYVQLVAIETKLDASSEFRSLAQGGWKLVVNIAVGRHGTRVLRFSKVLRKSKLSEPHTRAQRIYKDGSTTTKNKPYFVRLVGRL